ncbi:MAG: LysM peptidoglycan-binding domain-containing protein [Planctomycetaceae bacterium]
MHPDRKVGFAMGILLAGIVAALFFRNEPLLIEEMPSVNRERELNERLRERDVAVYLNDDADREPGAAAPDRDSADRHDWTLREFFDELEERNTGVPVPVGRQPLAPAAELTDVGRSTESRFVPPTIEMAATDTVAAKQDVSQATALEAMEELAGRISTGSSGNAAEQPAATAPPVDYDEYTVQYGDTLSGIAERFMGSQQKYQELFEANRDRLPSADRLQVGKAIRIPRTMQ